MPRAAGLRVPRLTGIPQTAGVSSRDALTDAHRARLSLALLDAGVSDWTVWQLSRTPERFLQRALTGFVQAHGGDLIADRIGLDLRLDVSLDPWGGVPIYGPQSSVTRASLAAEENGAPPGCYLALEGTSGNATQFVGHCLEWLAAWHPGLPRTVYLGILALNQVGRLYDWNDAREFEACYLQGMEEAELAERFEEYGRAEVPAALGEGPASNALTRRQIAALRRQWPREVRELADAALAADELAKRFHRARWHSGRGAKPRGGCFCGAGRARTPCTAEMPTDHPELLTYDWREPSPSLFLAAHENDATCAAFDDEWCRSDDGCPCAPHAAWDLSRPTVAHVRAVFDELGRMLDIAHAVARVLAAMPSEAQCRAMLADVNTRRAPRPRTLVEILCENAGEEEVRVAEPIRVRVA